VTKKFEPWLADIFCLNWYCTYFLFMNDIKLVVIWMATFIQVSMVVLWSGLKCLLIADILHLLVDMAAYTSWQPGFDNIMSVNIDWFLQWFTPFVNFYACGFVLMSEKKIIKIIIEKSLFNYRMLTSTILPFSCHFIFYSIFDDLNFCTQCCINWPVILYIPQNSQSHHITLAREAIFL